MKKVLIAYDGSTGAEIAVRDLLRAGLGPEVEALILTIADVWLPPPAVPNEDVLFENCKFEARYEKALEALREARKIAVQGAQTVHHLFPNWRVSNLAKPESPAWGILAE